MKEFKFVMIMQNIYNHHILEQNVDIFAHNLQNAIDEFILKGVPDEYELIDYKLK